MKTAKNLMCCWQTNLQKWRRRPSFKSVLNLSKRYIFLTILIRRSSPTRILPWTCHKIRKWSSALLNSNRKEKHTWQRRELSEGSIPIRQPCSEKLGRRDTWGFWTKSLNLRSSCDQAFRTDLENWRRTSTSSFCFRDWMGSKGKCKSSKLWINRMSTTTPFTSATPNFLEMAKADSVEATGSSQWIKFWRTLVTCHLKLFLSRRKTNPNTCWMQTSIKTNFCPRFNLSLKSSEWFPFRTPWAKLEIAVKALSFNFRS